MKKTRICIAATVGLILLSLAPTTNSAATNSTTTESSGYVSITFDDGTRSILDNAIPILDAAKLPSTQYVITSYLDGHDPNFMNAAEIIRLKAHGHEIGSHTQLHLFLPSQSENTVIDELRQSKKDLAEIGITATTFAYPMGGYNAAVINEVKRAGYLGARTTDRGWDGPNLNAYQLKVQNIYPGTTLQTIIGKIDWALHNRTWVIFVFHNITPKPAEGGTTTAILKGTVNYLVKQKAHVVTVDQGLRLRRQLSIPPVR